MGGKVGWGEVGGGGGEKENGDWKKLAAINHAAQMEAEEEKTKSKSTDQWQVLHGTLTTDQPLVSWFLINKVVTASLGTYSAAIITQLTSSF